MTPPNAALHRLRPWSLAPLPPALLLCSCAALRALAPPVPHSLAVRVLLDGRDVGAAEAASEGVAIEVRERGERAWVLVRNVGDRPRVIEQVSFEHRFPEAGPRFPVGDRQSAVPGPQPAKDGPGTGNGGPAAPPVVLHGPRAFVRGKDAGYTATIDAAEAEAEAFNGGVRFWYTPYRALAPGETYASHALVSVPTSLSGFRLRPAQGPFYNSPVGVPSPARRSPQGEGVGSPSLEGLDLGEIRAVQEAVAREGPPHDRPIIQHVGGLGDTPTLCDPRVVLADIDTCADLGIEHHLLYEDLGSWTAENPSEEDLRRAFAHAEKRGVKLGIAVFTNAPSYVNARPWRPDKPEWAIVQADGKPLGARCIGNAAFADWLSEEIERRLAAWPFRLVEFDYLTIAPCHATDHGHPPGDASRYAQARGAEALVRRLKERRPDVIVAAGPGWEPYASRLGRGIDLQSFVDAGAPMPFPGFSLARNVADRQRKTRLLAHLFRFLPTDAHVGAVFFRRDAAEVEGTQGIVVREGPGGRPLTPASAILRYTFLQNLATCGNMRLGGLDAWIGEAARGTRAAEEIAADRAFLRTWIRFAYDHWDLLRATRFLTAPDVEPNNVEVYGHLARAEGLVFIVNPNAREARVRFETEGSSRWTRIADDGDEAAPEYTTLTARISPPFTMPALIQRNDREVIAVVPPHAVAVLRARRGTAEDLRAVQASVLAPRHAPPSSLFYPRPMTLDAWAGAYFLAQPERAIAWRKIEIPGGFAAEATVRLAAADLTGDLTFGVHLLQPERAEIPAVSVNGEPARVSPVRLRAPSASAADLLSGFAVASDETARLVRAGDNRIRVEVRPPRAQAGAGAPWRSLFNGRDLDGWTPVGSAIWRVEDGAIVGTQDGDAAKSGLLTTRDAWRDFELVLEFTIDEHRTYNSGVYIRNDPGTAARTGYQVNIGNGAFGEYCGGIFLHDWKAKGDETDTIRRKGAWNELRILAQGARFTVDLNGVRVADYTDPSPDPKTMQSGVIGLQTYGAEGHAGWVKFRNIMIREVR